MLVVQPDGSKIYYVDYSILSTFATCKEKCRLAHKLKLEKSEEKLSLTFGSAFHAGVALLTCGYSIDDAKLAFVEECKDRNSSMKLSMTDEGDKRSVERGLVLLEAYQEKWKNEPYEVLRRPDNNKPYVEIGFRIFITEWIDGIPVVLCGLIDALVRNKIDGRTYIKETKTTTQGLSYFIQQTKPNKQVTIYNFASKELLKLEPAGTIWDCIYVSDRKPKDKGSYWEKHGVDIDKDLARSTTARSSVDLDELLFDLHEMIKEYLTWYNRKDVSRWIRNDPTACNMFGGCQFKDICISNCNPMIIKSLYRKREWKPWDERELRLPVVKG